VSSIATTGATGTGQAPQPFATINTAPTNTQSGLETIQDQHPAGATKAQTGDYNLLLRFPNGGGGAFQLNQTETFNLVSNSAAFNALSFFTFASQTAGGQPNPAPLAVASFTNAGGTAGSGTAFVAAVPEPRSLALLAAGICLVAGLAAPRRSIGV
jgi:hypothetical protein